MLAIRKITSAQTWPLRRQELYPDSPIQEMGMPEDEQGTHFGLYHQEELRGVVSAFKQQDGLQFRKLAVSSEFQRLGYGKLLLQHLENFALLHGLTNIWCNARDSAAGFYEKNGYSKTQTSFTRKGIGYVIMNKILTI